jgi:predicted ATPase
MPLPPEDRSNLVGTQLNERYRIDDILGLGSMGDVYRARDTLLKRDAAVKVVSHKSLGTSGRARLLHEAQYIAKLNHPNIVSVYDAGDQDGLPFIVMELVEGQTLHETMPDDLETILSIAGDICKALQHAHAQGIIHRDIKPENVVLDGSGTAKLMDFGIALSAASRLTEEGTLLGTVFYISPEQALGKPIDQRADLYSLGVLLYELVCGRLPFEVDDPLALISQHLHAPLVPPRAVKDGIPPGLNDLIVCLLHKDPDDRPPSADAVLKALKSIDRQAVGTTPSGERSMLERIVRGRMVGRQAEFEQARRLWKGALAGQGQALLVSGEPGIGKTRLVREIITHVGVTGGAALVGEAYAESAQPFGTFIQILQQALQLPQTGNLDIPDAVLADLVMLVPEVAEQFRKVDPNPSADRESERLRLLENMAVFLQLLSEGVPLLVVVDDIHWVDSATLTLFLHLVRRSRDRRLMVVAAYREVELGDARPFNEMLLELNRQRLSSRIKLERLNREQTRTLLGTIFQEAITKAFLDGIYRETEGIPFFVEEVCRALIDSGKLVFKDGIWDRPDDIEELEIPQGIQMAVEARLERLSPEVQDTLRAAAVFGREFPYSLLLQARGGEEDDLIEALEEAEAAQIMRVGESKGEVVLRFEHALVQQSILDGVNLLRRRKLHRLAVAAYEAVQPENYGALAYHSIRSGRDEDALRYFTLVGKQALQKHANVEAREYFQSALEIVEDEDERVDLLADLAEAQYRTSRLSQAYQTGMQAVEGFKALNVLERLPYLYRLCTRILYEQKGIKEAEICAESGLADLQGEPDSPDLALFLAEAARAYRFNRRDLAEQYGRRALEIARELGVPAAEAEALSALAVLPGISVEESLSMIREAVDVAERYHLLLTAMHTHYTYGVHLDFRKGNISESHQHYLRALEIARKIGSGHLEIKYLTRTADLYSEAGRFDKIEAILEELEDLLSIYRDFRMGQAYRMWRKLALDFDRGDFATATSKTDTIIDTIEKSGRKDGLINGLTTKWHQQSRLRQYVQAERTARKMIEINETFDPDNPIPKIRLVLSLLRLGRADEAHLEAGMLTEQTLEHGFYEWTLYRLMHAELVAADSDWKSAFDIYKEVADTYSKRELLTSRAYLLLDWAELHLRRGTEADRLHARTRLEDARIFFDGAGAAGWVEEIDRRLGELD